MEFHWLIAMVIGMIVGLLLRQPEIKRMAKSNRLLRNENDYYFFLQELYKSKMTSNHDELQDLIRKANKLRLQYLDNEKAINKDSY